MARKQRAYGSRLSYSLDAGVTYTFVSDIRLITPPPEKRGKADITHLESPNEGDEQMPGMQATAELKCECLFHQTRYTTLRNLQKTAGSAFDTSSPPLFKIELPVLFGQTTRATMVIPGFISETTIKELKNDDNAVILEFSIQESNCGRTWTEGA
jgi:hypothetical protein